MGPAATGLWPWGSPSYPTADAAGGTLHPIRGPRDRKRLASTSTLVMRRMLPRRRRRPPTVTAVAATIGAPHRGIVRSIYYFVDRRIPALRPGPSPTRATK